MRFVRGFLGVKIKRPMFLCTSLFLASCLSSNLSPNAFNSKETVNSAVNSEDAQNNSPPTAENAAPNACSYLNKNTPQFQFCIQCKNYILERQNTNPSAQYDFMGWLNQCISQSIAFGSPSGDLCTIQCPYGKTLDAKNCSCQDIIQRFVATDPHAPNITTYWSAQQSKNEGTNLCTAEVPLRFEITNRGNTDFFKNKYEVEKIDPLCSDDILSNVENPKPQSLGLATSSFKISTRGLAQYEKLNVPLHWTPALTQTLSHLSYNQADQSFYGPFAGKNQFEADLGEAAAGLYLFKFELFVFDDVDVSNSNFEMTLKVNNNDLDALVSTFSNKIPFYYGRTRRPTVFNLDYYANFDINQPALPPYQCERRGKRPPACPPPPSPAQPVGKFSSYLVTKIFGHEGMGKPIKIILSGTTTTTTRWGINHPEILSHKGPRCAVNYSVTDSSNLTQTQSLNFSLKTYCYHQDGPMSAVLAPHPDLKCECRAELDSKNRE